MTEVAPQPNDIFSFQEACAYLEIHPQTAEHHQRQGNLTPDRQLLNGNRIYYRHTLDTFKEEHQSDGLTIQDIHEMWKISKRAAHHALRVKRNVEPLGKRGRGGAFAFNPNMIVIIAEADGWEVRQPAQESDQESPQPPELSGSESVCEPAQG